MDKIKIAITGRVASVVALPEVVADNTEYEVDFALDPREGWDISLPITALFVRRDGSYTARILDAGATSCTMPPQTGTNVVYIGLTQEEMRTTTPARIPIRRSVRTMTDFPPLPDKDVYAQILANFAGLRMLSGKGAPTTETAGKINQLYRDEDNNRIYVCVDNVSGYTWAMISGSGGGGSAVTIDTTLTKSGQAADAKAAGDAIGKKLDATELPTAINDALAQAKASGEFDGAKGDKGDTGPEGPKGDTGPVGPKGADGKDGAGMDVTGAKIGQIAKITAVDSAGKPTGWEPVDMPSSEEEFIQTIPMSSDVGEYVLADLTVYKKVRIIITKSYKNIGTGSPFIIVKKQGTSVQNFNIGGDFVKYAFAESIYEENGETYTVTTYYSNNAITQENMRRTISKKRDTDHENQQLKLSIPVSYLAELSENAHIDVYGVKK